MTCRHLAISTRTQDMGQALKALLPWWVPDVVVDLLIWSAWDDGVAVPTPDAVTHRAQCGPAHKLEKPCSD